MIVHTLHSYINPGFLKHMCQYLLFSLECKTEKGKHCIFPFEFRGKKYNACTVDYSKKKKWCATAVHRNGTVIKNNWGYCVMDFEGKIYFHFLYIYKSADYYVIMLLVCLTVLAKAPYQKSFVQSTWRVFSD